MWTFCCCMTTNNITWKNFFKNMCTNIYVSDVKSFNIWAQICDQTARAGNWQKWRFQTFFFIFIINLYKCGKMYFILIIHHRVKCRASILGFCIFEHLRKRFFSPTNWCLSKWRPPAVGKYNRKKNWGSGFQAILSANLKDTISCK